MSEIQRIIEGRLTLGEIEETIALKEAFRKQFLHCEVAEHEGRPANLVSFEDLGFGPAPKRLVLTMKAPAIGGVKPEWQGDMCVENHVVNVWAFRNR